MRVRYRFETIDGPRAPFRLYLVSRSLEVAPPAGEPDQELHQKRKVYDHIHLLNSAFFHHLRGSSGTSASMNAVVHLSMVALILPLRIHLRLPEVLECFGPSVEADAV